MTRVAFFRRRLGVPSETFVRHIRELADPLPSRMIGWSTVDQPARGLAAHRWLANHRSVIPAWRSMRAFDPDVIHAHYLRDALDLFALGAHRLAPILISVHGYDVNNSTRTLARSGIGGTALGLARLAIQRWPATFLAHSSFMADQLAGLGVASTSISTVHLPVTIPESTASLVERDRSIVFVGRLERAKGPDLFLELAALAHRIDPSLRFVMIGEGSLRPSLEESIATRRLPIELAGWLSQTELATRVRRSRLAISTSRSEGLGLAGLEAQALGTPLVALDVGGISETIAPVSHPIALHQCVNPVFARSIVELANDDERWAELSAAGRRWVEMHFNRSTQGKRLRRLLIATASNEHNTPIPAARVSSRQATEPATI